MIFFKGRPADGIVTPSMQVAGKNSGRPCTGREHGDKDWVTLDAATEYVLLPGEHEPDTPATSGHLSR